MLQLKLSGKKTCSVIRRVALLMNPVRLHHPTHILNILEQAIFVLVPNVILMSSLKW